MNTKRVHEAGLPIVPYDGSHICNRRHPSRTYTLPREKKIMAETPGLEPGEACNPTA